MMIAERTIRLKDGTSCLLRSPGPSDAAQMLDYLRLTSGETHYMIRYPEEVVMTEEAEARYLRNTLEHETSFMIAAFIDGMLAGNAGVNQTAGPFIKVRHRGDFGISIKQQFWGAGLGKALTLACLEEAGQAGYEQMELGVFSDNQRAIGLYQRCGYEIWGTVKRAYRLKDGSYRDELHMGVFL